MGNDSIPEKRDAMLFYRSFWESIRELDPDNQAAILKAIMEYALDGVEPEISGVLKSLFSLIRPQIDANNRRYQNGKSGGRPKNCETKAEPINNQSETKVKPNHNQTGT